MYTIERFLYIHSANDHIKKWILLSIFECYCCHPLIYKWIFERDPPLSILSFSLSKAIIINCKIRQKNQPLCLIIAFDLRHIYVQISCTEHTIPLIIGLSIKMSWKVCMISHWFFFSLNLIFFSMVEMKWRKMKKKRRQQLFILSSWWWQQQYIVLEYSIKRVPFCVLKKWHI
jgi:hypothetical protein